jgi:hypothetical protein
MTEQIVPKFSTRGSEVLMKKIIQFISFAFIAVVLSFVSVKAQSIQKFNADIPFSFTVAGKTYDAGNYKVKIVKQNGSGVLTLLDSRGKTLDIFAVSATNNSGSVSSFEFANSGGDRTLTRIVSTDASFQVPEVGSKARETLANRRGRSSTSN